jgi:hypothetical protein
MKTNILFILFFISSFFTVKAQYSGSDIFGDISSKCNTINTSGNFINNAKNNIDLTQYASINNSNESCNLLQHCSNNNLKFELDKKIIFEKEIGYPAQYSSNNYLNAGSRKKGHGRVVAGAILLGLGIVQIVGGIALKVSSAEEKTSSDSGQSDVSPANGIIGTVLMINGGVMTSIGARLLIPVKNKNKFRRRR